MNTVQPSAKDNDNLNLLAVFHYVLAGLGALFACFPVVHIVMGALMLRGSPSLFQGANPPPPHFLGFFFIILGSIFILLGWAMAFCTFLSGRFIAKRKNRTFSVVVGAVLCAFVPFGTILGVFTVIALSKESTIALYKANQPQTGTEPPIT